MSRTGQKFSSDHLKERVNPSIENKVVLIAGTLNEWGEASARLLAKEGASILLGAGHPERIQALAGEILSAGGIALALETDVTDSRQVQALVDATLRIYGRIDVLINIPGWISLPENSEPGEWNREINTRISSMPHTVAAVLPGMKERKAGHIINVASDAGFRAEPGEAVQPAIQEVVRCVSRELDLEIPPDYVRMTQISTDILSAEMFAEAILSAVSQPREMGLGECVWPSPPGDNTKDHV